MRVPLTSWLTGALLSYQRIQTQKGSNYNFCFMQKKMLKQKHNSIRFVSPSEIPQILGGICWVPKQLLPVHCHPPGSRGPSARSCRTGSTPPPAQRQTGSRGPGGLSRCISSTSAPSPPSWHRGTLGPGGQAVGNTGWMGSTEGKKLPNVITSQRNYQYV